MPSIFDIGIAALIKKGKHLPIEIISSEIIPGSQSFKTSIHQNIGDGDNYEFMGFGEERIQIKIYCKNKETYNELINFLKDGSSFLLSAGDVWEETQSVNLDGPISTENYYKDGACTATLNITTAKNINDTDASKLDRLDYLFGLKLEKLLKAKSFAEKMFDYGKAAFDFTSNTNKKVGTVTNQIAVMAAGITNATQGLASASTIITNPISSVKNSVSQVIGGVSGMITSFQNAINAIRQIPDNIDGFIDAISSIGDQLNSLFDFDDPNDTLKYNTTLLQDVALAIINPDFSQDNPAIPEYDPEVDTNQNPTSAPEFFLTSVKSDNSDALSIIMLGSILITIYQNAAKINRWNKTDLDKLRKTTESIYDFINAKDLTFDFRLQLDLARNSFFDLFKTLYDRSIKTILVEIVEPRLLADIIYSVNGNLDYYNETKQLNSIVGTTVDTDILVIGND